MKEDVRKSLRIVATLLKDEIESHENGNKISLDELEKHISKNDLDGAVSIIHGLSRYKLALLVRKAEVRKSTGRE